MASKYKKLDHEKWIDEEFKRKSFFHDLDLEGIRTMMRISGGMVQTICGNYKQMYRKRNLPITG